MSEEWDEFDYLEEDYLEEDFNVVCSKINFEYLLENYYFLRENVSGLLEVFSDLIDFAYYTTSTLGVVSKLRERGKYADYVVPYALAYIVFPHVHGSYINLMLGYPYYTLFSFRVIAEAVVASVYVDLKLHGKTLSEKISSREYLYFGLCSLHRSRLDAERVFGKDFVEKACELIGELSSLWIHPVASYKKTKSSRRIPAGQLYAVIVHLKFTGKPPSYVYSQLYTEEDLPILMSIRDLAYRLKEIVFHAYGLWCKKFGIGPYPETKR